MLIMMVVKVVLIKIIVEYKEWVYKVIWGKVEKRMIEDERKKD